MGVQSRNVLKRPNLTQKLISYHLCDLYTHTIRFITLLVEDHTYLSSRILPPSHLQGKIQIVCVYRSHMWKDNNFWVKFGLLKTFGLCTPILGDLSLILCENRCAEMFFIRCVYLVSLKSG